MKVSFKNLSRSQITREVVRLRLERIFAKYPDLFNHQIDVVLEMLNSPSCAGPDSFAVRLTISGVKYRNLCIEARDNHLFAALARVCDRVHDALNRTGDKARVKSIKAQRKLKVVAFEDKLLTPEEARFFEGKKIAIC